MTDPNRTNGIYRLQRELSEIKRILLALSVAQLGTVAALIIVVVATRG
jgi:hypothetical protein